MSRCVRNVDEDTPSANQQKERPNLSPAHASVAQSALPDHNIHEPSSPSFSVLKPTSLVTASCGLPFPFPAMGATKSEHNRGNGSETESERIDRRIGESSGKLKFLKGELKVKVKDGREKTKAFKDASKKLDVMFAEHISLVGLEDLHK